MCGGWALKAKRQPESKCKFLRVVDARKRVSFLEQFYKNFKFAK